MADPRSQLAVPVGLVITVVWTASAGVGLVTGKFTGLEIVTPLMVMFAGYLFGINIVRTVGRSASSSRPPVRRRS